MVDAAGRPVAGAIVRLKGTSVARETGADGRFALPGTTSLHARITAAKEGYYIAGVNRVAGPVRIALERHRDSDVADYTWLQPSVPRSTPHRWFTSSVLRIAARISFDHLFLPVIRKMKLGCRDCHAPEVYEEWASSAHARGARNPRFMTMYLGRDMAGRQSPETRFGSSPDYGRFPLRRDPEKIDAGPGYRLDFPRSAGNCAACHLPGAAADRPYETRPDQVRGVNVEGIHCDFCHKIAEAILDPETGRPYPNRPGVMSYRMLRPGSEKQIFLGPLDDVDVGVDAYLPLMKESEICAPCHDASFWGTPIYESFAEWKASSYASRGESCQSCHMKPSGQMTNLAPCCGGVERMPHTLATHSFPGADPVLLRNAVSLDVRTSVAEEILDVTAIVKNDRSGHHVPTDSPLRHVMLVVDARDAGGVLLQQVKGPMLPEWCGAGDRASDDFAGKPGKVYAKILEEIWNGVSPSASYWNRTRIVSDTRIAADASDTASFQFDARRSSRVDVCVKLIYRRAFLPLARQKGWNDPDIVMATRESSLIVDHPRCLADGGSPC